MSHWAATNGAILPFPTPKKRPTRPRIGRFIYVQLAVGLTSSRRLRGFFAGGQADQIVEG